MKLQFTPQPYQDAAVAAVVGLFHGEGDIARRYVRGGMLTDSVGNDLPVGIERIGKNLHAVQRENCLPLTDGAASLSFCVEMETGTGKTYVYIKTIYELHALYGLSKFVVVVPSIAIREGVKKSFEMTHEHFQTQYDRQPIRWFIYNSARLGDVKEFAQSTGIEVMIINIDAFRKSENIIHQQMDRMNSGRAIDLIRDVRPVVVIDEPQSVDNTPKAKEAISWLHPLFTLRYSATHREKINTLYRLTPVDAYQQGLVKQISVSSIAAMDDFNQPYVRLVGVDNASGYKARVELDVKSKAGKLSRITRTVGVGAELYIASGEREVYRGWRVTDIDCTPEFERIELNGATVLPLGQAMGDIADAEIKRGQIRKTIEIHLNKEKRLLSQGVKVLSLFFIDRVERYRSYDGENAVQGEYARMFEEEYERLIAQPEYAPILEAMPHAKDAAGAHEGYFSIDKKGKLKNTRGDTADDQDTYALIMRDKEKLLSFETPLRFIFSHSALREGWDNPNVFQVCTLLEQTSALSARQKIGRGLRLCVNQDGERLYDRQINNLHVVASEHVAEFADNLQKEIEQETGVNFGMVEIASFIDIEVSVEVARGLGIEVTPEEALSPTSIGDNAWSEPSLPTYTPPAPNAAPPALAPMVRLGYDGAKRVFDTLQSQKVIDAKGKINVTELEKFEQGKLELPEAYQPIASPVIDVIRRANTRIVVRDASKEIIVRQKKQVFLSPEFREIWERIRQKTRYRVRMDEDIFVEAVASRLRMMPPIQRARIVETTAKVDMQKSGVTTGDTHMRAITLDHEPTPLPDLLFVLCSELRLHMATLLRVLKQCGRTEDFINNPERFLEEALPILRDCKAEMVMDGIRYQKLAGQEYSVQEIFDKDELIAYLDGNAVVVDKSVFDHVITDPSGVERRFARALDDDPDVKLFFKLPLGFKIDTPLGTYNPDWAVLLGGKGVERLYFVLETKGSTRTLDLRGQEVIKIECGRRHFAALDGVTFDAASDWRQFRFRT